MEAGNQIFFALVEEQLAEGRQVKIALKGTSMLPTLHEGDTLTLCPLSHDPEVGDVVLFRYGGGHRLHRVVEHDGDRYCMQGDNCYTCEVIGRQDMVAGLTAAERGGAAVEWRKGRQILRRSATKRCAYRWLGREGRRRLRPWYFGAVAFLMWAPLNGVGIPLDNYILGLRSDHLLHASVYIPCTLFLMDLFRGRSTKAGGRKHQVFLTWLAAVAIGLLTEGVQYLLPYRGYDVNDLIANALGVTLGWIVIRLIRHKIRHI